MNKIEKEIIGCGKRFTIRPFKNCYKVVCGGFLRYGSKNKVYCSECLKDTDGGSA